MKIAQIYAILDKIAPFNSQESWDNSGLLIGDMDSEISNIYAALDADFDLIQTLNENSLLITHHPLIFKGLKSLDFKTYPSKIIHFLVQKNISLIAMHTNYDLAVLNRYFCEEILELKVKQKDGFLIYCDTNLDFGGLCNLVKNRLNLSNLRIAKATNKANKIAICTGSGADLISEIKADVFLTGDIKYHAAMQAIENGLNLIDIGHFESERYFGESLLKELQNFNLKAIIANSKNPFTYC